MRNLILTIICYISIALATSCTVPQLNHTQKTYNSYQKKERETVPKTYSIPSIKANQSTKQQQTKGDVTISVIIEPITTITKQSTSESIIEMDPSQPGFDIYEIKSSPILATTSEYINFKIKIRNKSQVPLKLYEVGFALIIDGIQWSFPKENVTDWERGLVLTGFEKEYLIKGPQISSLNNPQVVYLFLNGIPTIYDGAGNVKQKSNFEWFFECKNEQVTKDEDVIYSYESRPIHKELCKICTGTGNAPQLHKCDKCSGAGTYVNIIDKKTYKCSKCAGTGNMKVQCRSCTGKGEKEYPKSPMPQAASTVNWNGWWVNIRTIPAGATVMHMNPENGIYKPSNLVSPCRVPWYYTKGSSSPLIIEHGGKQVKINPYKPDGSPSQKILVNFTGDTPIVTYGKQVH